MSANFYELLKYANTGIASPGMTYYDKMRALAMTGGGTIKTLTGIPPLSFTGNGKPLISWSLLGNTQQTGTPSPDNIIMPTFCGVRTGNLARYWKAAYITASGALSENRVNGISFPVKIESGQTVCFTNPKANFGRGIAVFSGFDGETLTDMVYRSTNNTVTYTADSECYVTIWGNYDNTTSMDESVFALCGQMLNLGSTALPYEPYGWAEKITCAGQTVPVYLGTVQTVRRAKKLVLTGEEQWQSFSDVLGTWQLYINNISLGGVAQSSCMSNIAPYGATATTRQKYDYGCYLVTGGNGVGFQMKGAKDTFTGIPSWKSYLAQQYASGHPVTIWYVLATPETGIVNEPLCKIGDYADELHSSDAGVSIPTARGENVLTVDTDLQPSSVTIRYKADD